MAESFSMISRSQQIAERHLDAEGIPEVVD
jgi:hypothetical protein